MNRNGSKSAGSSWAVPVNGFQRWNHYSQIRLLVPRWEQPKIEPISGLNHLSDSDLLREHYMMGQAKSWIFNRIEPLSSDPLSGLDCIIIIIKSTMHLCNEWVEPLMNMWKFQWMWATYNPSWWSPMSGAELGDSFSQADLCPTVGKGSAGLHITHKETETSFF